MKMSENQKNYEPLVIPIDKPFKQLSKTEAKSYFEWFISHVGERSDYIRQKVSNGLGISVDELNFSMESLIPIWKWFLQIAELSKTPKDVLKKIRRELKANKEPDEFIEGMIREHRIELSVFSRYVIRDIGMYVGKMFVTNFPTLRWDYHINTKQDSFANMPQVFGFVDTAYTPPFETQFEPIHFTEMQASNLFDGTQNQKDLYNICQRWAQWVPKETT